MQTIHIRPPVDSPYGDGSGSSYDNAMSGFRDIPNELTDAELLVWDRHFFNVSGYLNIVGAYGVSVVFQPGAALWGNWKDHCIAVRDSKSVSVEYARLYQAQHAIKVDNCIDTHIYKPTIGGCTRTGVRLVGAMQTTIAGGSMDGVGNGVYAYQPDGLQVRGMQIRNVSGTDDSHGIGVQDGHSVYIAHNAIFDTDGAMVSCYSNPDAEMTDVLIAFNLLVGSTGKARTGSRGVVLGGANGNGRIRHNLRVAKNTILGCVDSMYLKTNSVYTGEPCIIATGNRYDGNIVHGKIDDAAERAYVFDNEEWPR